MLTALLIAVILFGAAHIWEQRKMSEALDRLTNEVSEQTTVIDSAVALITSLAQQIRDHIDDSDALNALADDLDAKTNALAAAVSANTAAEQPPAEQPPAEQPPAEQPPAEQPPAEQPPADTGEEPTA